MFLSLARVHTHVQTHAPTRADRVCTFRYRRVWSRAAVRLAAKVTGFK